MQKLISKYGLAAHLALLAVAPLFLFPFLAVDAIATTELWLSAFALVWVLMEPSRRSDEMLHDARTRVASSIVRDPLFWALLGAVVFAAIRWANGGVAMACDFNNGAPVWSLKPPACPFLPGGVSGSGYPLFAAALAALVLVQGCVHALGKSARIAFLFTAATMSGLAALLGVALCETGCAGALAAAWCGEMTRASFVGTVFGLGLLAGVASLIGVFECHWTRQTLLLIFAVGGNLVGLFFFAPTPVALVHLAAAVVALAVALAYAAVRLGVSQAAKCLSVLAIVLLIPVLVVLGVSVFGEKADARIASVVRTARMSANPEPVSASPAELAQAAMYQASTNRLALFSGGDLFPAGYAARRTALSDVAARVWREHPWLGTGVGSFGLAMRFAALPADWAVFNPRPDELVFVDALRQGFGDMPDRERPAGFVRFPDDWRDIGAERVSTPFNGWWALLAERGIVGALVLAVVLGFLLFHYVQRLLGARGRSVFVPGAAVGVLALVALAAEAFIDASFLRPDVLVVAAAFLAVSVSSFPPARKKAEGSAADGTSETNAGS